MILDVPPEVLLEMLLESLRCYDDDEDVLANVWKEFSLIELI